MNSILTVGITTLDIINRVEHYPQEDEEIRAISQHQTRGGNAANTAVVLSQLGHLCDWVGVLVDEADVHLIKQDFDYFGVGTQHSKWLDHGKMPTSYVTINQQSGSRTIIHYRDCPELDFLHFQQLPLTDYNWIHFEGRNITELKQMLEWLTQHHPEITCSLEVEKPRNGIEQLFDYADVLMFSRPYAESCGFDSAATFLQHLTSTAMATCSWGQHGAWLKYEQAIIHCPAVAPAQLVDTLGAGDTFNAGLISSLSHQQSAEQALQFACQLAGKKCGQLGFDRLSVSLHDSVNFFTDDTTG